MNVQLKKNEAAATAYDEAAISSGGRASLDGQGGADARKPRVNNSLILGGSNEALKLSLLGPQTQEMKKQTNILKQIGENTSKTATALGNMNTNAEKLIEVN